MPNLRVMTDILTYFRCNETQQTVYLTCLKQGRMTVKELSEITGNNRVTIHSAVEELIDRGLLYETWLKKKRFVLAEGPEALQKLFEIKKAEMHSAELNLNHAIGLIEEITKSAKSRSRPTVEFYEGVVGFRKMLQDTLQSKDFVYIVVAVDKFSEIVDTEYFLEYFKKRAAKGIRTKVVYPPCDFASHVFERRKEFNMEVHILPPEIVWNSGIFSWNDNIALISFSEQQQLTTTIIKNRDITFLFQSILFEALLKQAKSMVSIDN